MTFECAICREPCTEDDAVPVHDGHKHCFHKQCIYAYLESSLTPRCPICTQSLDPQSLLDSIAYKESSKLMEAAEKNQHHVATKLLSEIKYCINEYFPFYDIFVNACEYGSLEFIQVLINHVNSRNVVPMYDLLPCAAKFGDLDIVKYLVESLGMDPGKEDSFAFVEACSFGDMETVEYLHFIDENNPISVNALNKGLVEAVSFDNIECAEYLLTFPGADLLANEGEALVMAGEYVSRPRLPLFQWIVGKIGDPGAFGSRILKNLYVYKEIEVLRYILSFP